MITKANLDEIVQINRNIKNETQQHVTEFEQKYVKNSFVTREKVAYDLLKNYHLIQLPIEDEYWGGAIKKFADGTMVSIINTNQPRLYQYFIYFHELYHILFDRDFQEGNHNITTDLEVNERKADYFAALTMMGRELYPFFSSLAHEAFFHKAAICMERFRVPFKAVLVQLYEEAVAQGNTAVQTEVKQHIDRKLSPVEWKEIFEYLGLDFGLLEPSNVLHFGEIEEIVEKKIKLFPDMDSHRSNLAYLRHMKEQYKGLLEQRNE